MLKMAFLRSRSCLLVLLGGFFIFSSLSLSGIPEASAQNRFRDNDLERPVITGPLYNGDVIIRGRYNASYQNVHFELIKNVQDAHEGAVPGVNGNFEFRVDWRGGVLQAGDRMAVVMVFPPERTCGPEHCTDGPEHFAVSEEVVVREYRLPAPIIMTRLYAGDNGIFVQYDASHYSYGAPFTTHLKVFRNNEMLVREVIDGDEYHMDQMTIQLPGDEQLGAGDNIYALLEVTTQDWRHVFDSATGRNVRVAALPALDRPVITSTLSAGSSRLRGTYNPIHVDASLLVYINNEVVHSVERLQDGVFDILLPAEIVLEEGQRVKVGLGARYNANSVPLQSAQSREVVVRSSEQGNGGSNLDIVEPIYAGDRPFMVRFSPQLQDVLMTIYINGREDGMRAPRQEEQRTGELGIFMPEVSPLRGGDEVRIEMEARRQRGAALEPFQDRAIVHPLPSLQPPVIQAPLEMDDRRVRGIYDPHCGSPVIEVFVNNQSVAREEHPQNGEFDVEIPDALHGQADVHVISHCTIQGNRQQDVRSAIV
ncbi:MAG: hypothetical protein NUV91_09805, partial [Candidatus Omnitrophica bacterium]|nr:hypothetical protein [Candidatus Omnitrophota bacterium]